MYIQCDDKISPMNHAHLFKHDKNYPQNSITSQLKMFSHRQLKSGSEKKIVCETSACTAPYVTCIFEKYKKLASIFSLSIVEILWNVMYR